LKGLGSFVVSIGELTDISAKHTASIFRVKQPIDLKMNALRSMEIQNTLQPARRVESTEVFYSQNFDQSQSSERQMADGVCVLRLTIRSTAGLFREQVTG
jgi:hypothetical protein